MKQQDIIWRVSQFFQLATDPNISEKDIQKDCVLGELLHDKIKLNQSIEIMDGVLKGIICLATHSLFASQIRIQHIVKIDGKWGLQGAVCYRSKNIPKDSNDLTYDPQEYQLHLDQQNQLVWCLGKIWFKMITNQQINPQKTEDQIFQMIITQVKNNKKVRDVLMSMLRLDPNNRTTIQAIIRSGVFQSSNNEDQLDQRDINSSLVKHFSYINRRRYTHLHNSRNPFYQYLFYRDFEEQLQIDQFLVQIKKLIKTQFHHLNQNSQIEFSCEVVDAQRYLSFKKLQDERQKQGYNTILLDKHNIYSEFTKKMYSLQHQLSKVIKKRKYSQLIEKYPQLFLQARNFNPNHVYSHFKGYLVDYISILRTKLKNNLTDMAIFKKISKLYIARTSSYIFKHYRTYIFQDFMNNKSITVKEILHQIDQSTDFYKIRDLERRIQQIYFSRKK